MKWKNLLIIIDDDNGEYIELKFTNKQIKLLYNNQEDLKDIVYQIDKYRPDLRQRL